MGIQLDRVINENYEKLNTVDQHILQFVQANLESCKKMNIADLAKLCNVSTATILRTAQKLNFSGYSEFKYFQKPVPSLQGLSGGRNVIYLGTFSKMLLPSIRISYMILPPELMETYEKRKNNYNQTASKAEQIALTQFIRDGHLASQVRKSRKIHLAKAEKLADSAKKILGKDVDVQVGAAGFMVQLTFAEDCAAEKIAEKAKKKGMTFLEVEKNRMLLTCAGVSAEKYEDAMKLLRECTEKGMN